MGLLWSFLNKCDHQPYWERVTSQANIADAVSRGDMSMAERLGWKRMETSWDDLYHIFVDATDSMEQAMSLGAALATSFGRVPRGQAANMAEERLTCDAAVAPTPKGAQRPR